MAQKAKTWFARGGKKILAQHFAGARNPWHAPGQDGRAWVGHDYAAYSVLPEWRDAAEGAWRAAEFTWDVLPKRRCRRLAAALSALAVAVTDAASGDYLDVKPWSVIRVGTSGEAVFAFGTDNELRALVRAELFRPIFGRLPPVRTVERLLSIRTPWRYRVGPMELRDYDGKRREEKALFVLRAEPLQLAAVLMPVADAEWFLKHGADRAAAECNEARVALVAGLAAER